MSMDDYYWKACCPLGKAFHEGLGTDRDLEYAVKLLSNAKELYDRHGEEPVCVDISKEDLYRVWVLVIQEAGMFIPIQGA